MTLIDTTVTTSQRIGDLQKNIRKMLGVKVSLCEMDIPGEQVIIIRYIIVPEKLRRRGLGTSAMQIICDYADQYGYALELTPDDYWGTPLPALRAWYHSLGFRRQCNVSATSTKPYMSREPRS